MGAAAVHVGTSGYSFADWVGPFYPEGTRSSGFLAYYARHFGCVEVNATYYRIPPPRTLEAMERRTPAGFRFIVKLHGSFTHEPDLPGESTVRDFLAVLEPLKAAGKYHGLLAQFPWGFRRGEASKAHLERLRSLFPGEPLWAEFRHASWMHPRLGDWLRERDLGYCAVDEPALPGLVPPVGLVTNGIAYARLHGRNAATWWGRGGSDRYDWNYSEAELREWAARIGTMAHEAKDAYLFFNNCHAGQAARNAKLMDELLRREQERAAR